MKKIYFIITLLLFIPVFCFAQSITINEIAWMGNKDSHYNEWVELLNNSSSTVNLKGWKIEGGLDIKLKGKIPAKCFYLLERTDDKSIKDKKADQIYKGGLNNEGEKIILKNKKGEIIEKLNFSSGWPEGDKQNNKTMEKTRNDKDEWQTSKLQGGTPKEKNSQGEKQEKFPLSANLQNKIPKNLNKTTAVLIGISLAFLSSLFFIITKKKLTKRKI